MVQEPTGTATSASLPGSKATSTRSHLNGRALDRWSTDLANLLAMAGDLTMILSGLLVGFWLRFSSGLIPRTQTWWTSGDGSTVQFKDYRLLIGIGTAILLGTFISQDLYQRKNLLRYRRTTKIIVQSSFTWLIAYLGLSLALKFDPPISRIYVLLSFVCSLGSLLIWRYLFHRFLHLGTVARGLRQKVVFVGWNENAARLASAIQYDSAQPYDLLGFISAPSAKAPDSANALLKNLGPYPELSELLIREGVDIVILADLEIPTENILALTNLCERLLVQFKVIPSYFQIMVSGLALETVSGVPILGFEELPLDRMPNRILKRIVDIVGSIIGLVLAAPVIAVCGALVWKESPGPIFYRQVRTGRGGRNFKIIKLRSMRLDAEQVGGAQWAKKDDNRRLRIGAFLREWNLDEVPQFWNVLKGEMSLVGPRPERPELIQNFQFEIPHYNSRLASKPGLTGWAQVNGLRGDTDLAERVRYDLFYLENWSVWLDFQIMVMTLISRKNAY